MEKLAKFRTEYLSCPICKEILHLDCASLKCKNSHCYDIAKSAYVNLVSKPKSMKGELYSKESFHYRNYILEKGYYKHILDEILIRLSSTMLICDAGCGEGYFARQISGALKSPMLAFDIDKQAISLAGKADKTGNVVWFVGDIANVAVKSNILDVVLNMFSPANYKEFKRILKPDGVLLKLVPTENHLIELRELAQSELKNKTYSNNNVIEQLQQNFDIQSKTELSKSYDIDTEDAIIFAAMTPLLSSIDKSRIDFSKLRKITVSAELILARPKY